MSVSIEDLGAFLQQMTPRDVPPNIRRKKQQRGLLLFGFIFFLFGLPFVYIFFPWGMADELALDLGSPATAQGTVTSVEKTGLSINKALVYAIRFTFSAPGGRTVEGISYETGKRVHEGRTVEIEYSTDDPTFCRVKGSRLTKTGYFTLFVIVFPAVGFFLMFFTWRSNQRNLHLLRNGVFTRGEVAAVDKTNVEVNRQPRYKITVSFDTDVGQTMTSYNAYGDEVRLARQRMESGEQVGILYNPDNRARVLLVDSLLG